MAHVWCMIVATTLLVGQLNAMKRKEPFLSSSPLTGQPPAGEAQKRRHVANSDSPNPFDAGVQPTTGAGSSNLFGGSDSGNSSDSPTTQHVARNLFGGTNTLHAGSDDEGGPAFPMIGASSEQFTSHVEPGWKEGAEHYNKVKTLKLEAKVNVYQSEYELTAGRPKVKCVVKGVAITKGDHLTEWKVAERLKSVKEQATASGHPLHLSIPNYYAWFTQMSRAYFVVEFVEPFTHPELLLDQAHPSNTASGPASGRRNSPVAGSSAAEETSYSFNKAFRHKYLLPAARKEYQHDVAKIIKESLSVGIYNEDFTLYNMIITWKKNATRNGLTAANAYKQTRAQMIDYGLGRVVTPQPGPNELVDAPLSPKMCKNFVELIYQMEHPEDLKDAGAILAKVHKYPDTPGTSVKALLRFIVNTPSGAAVGSGQPISRILEHAYFAAARTDAASAASSNPAL